MNTFQKDFVDYICSGHCLLHVNTHEKDRAIDRIGEAAKQINRTVYIWSVTTGWRNDQGISVSDVKPSCPVEESLAAITEFGENVICVLQDFDCYLRNETYPNFDIVVSWLNELRQMLSTSQQTIVFVGPAFEPPMGLKYDITPIDFALPDTQQIENQIMFACEDVRTKDGEKFEPDLGLLPQIVDACRGMTQQQIIDRATLALRKHGNFTKDAIKTLIREKAAVINASGLLNYVEPQIKGLSAVGGYEALKNHIKLDQPCFTEKARAFGIDFPKGILCVGVSGTGKTLMATAIAAEFGMPLITLDVGSLMGSLVGQSEQNLRTAIKVLESICPCTMMVDEIDKSFGGNSDLDGGTSKRVLGHFLQWMNNRTSPVYIVATANNVESLPVELLRSGRFDALFGFDLPDEDERQQIFDIHISKRGRDQASFDTKKLAQNAVGFVGADIEQSVKLGLKIAFARGQELKQSHVELAIEGIVPLSKVEPEKIKNVQEWCKKHTKMANPKSQAQMSRRVALK